MENTSLSIWNHSLKIVNSSPSFQSSLTLSSQSTPPIITLSSNSPTLDPEQHSHHCIRKQPDTTRTYLTLPIKLDQKFVVPPPALYGDHKNGEQLHNWAKEKISKSYKIIPGQKERALEFLKQSKITFLAEILVEQDKLIFHPQAAEPIFS